MRFFERKAPLDWTGPVSFQSLRPGTVVVAFSRRAVLALAGELNRRQPGKVAVLYGAMPLASRRLEIERFMSGQATVCCATDVLGHGVNLPCETLLFAESQKFDGEERRDLHAWEIAQIAGRAGRFGLVERGHVGVLTGIVWANADPGSDRVGAPPDRAAARAATWATGSSTPRGSGRASRICRSKRRNSFPPRFARGTRPRCASGRPTAGSRSSRSARCSSGSTPCSDGCSSAAASSRSSSSGSSSTRRSTRTTSSCSRRSRLPSPATVRSGRCCSGCSTSNRLRDASLEDAEQAARTASILRWFALQYPDVGGVTLEKAAELEEAAARRVSEKLAAEVSSPSVGRCKSCGQSCAPWFALCERCYGRR